MILNIASVISSYAVAAIILSILCVGLYKGVDVFDTFIKGAKQGIGTAFKIIPPLVGLMVAIGVFKASGVLDLIVYAITPLTAVIGIPPEVLPLAFLRPISGSASLAMLTDIITQYGPDSLQGRMASVMMGSTETTFYVFTVYLGAVGIKKAGKTIFAALIADATGIIASAFISNMLFL